MLVYIIRRMLQWIPVLLISSVIVFIVARALPGDPADVLAGTDATPDVIAEIRLAYGLDYPLPE